MASINTIITNISNQNISLLFENKITSFKPDKDVFTNAVNQEAPYSDPIKIGHAELKNHEELLVFTCEYNKELTARSAKKEQFEIAKKVLKEDFKDGAIFIFYDAQGNFRFSFIRRNYGDKTAKYSNWKRYTYYVEPSKHNKTFKNRIENCHFDSLDNIQEAFSVEPLNKQFYQQIAKAFYELISGNYYLGTKTISVAQPMLELPSTPYKGNETIYKEFAVRLIGRTIFCWFLKNKKSSTGIPLIPENWLASTSISEEQQGYYHSVLEKLFFLVLNKKMDDRNGFNLPPNAETIPFLNGGLFEAHQDDFFENNKANYSLKIPDHWFKDLFETLEQYNFTIDENSINDTEVSIDPEMLGTIFENLLAEIDPDTEKSARKATGSFYTPREIVDYMVEQSMVQYLKTKTQVTDEEALVQLFQEGQNITDAPYFNGIETEQLLKALSTVKILDPACGSGAFPMGALHKICLALEKLDPNADWWREQQVKFIPNAIARKNLKEKLDKSTSDYARKLGVIQNSIYGVDIQPLAAEISKLRSFLSLVIDENIDDTANNRGIEPLPNLEFKFVTANTLIGLPEEKGQQVSMFDNFEQLEQLAQLRSDYLQCSGDKKEKIKEQFLKVQKKAFSSEHNLFADQNSRSYKIISWNPFKNEPSSWFDPQWMFGVDKFDIVIGNPPYVFTRDVSFGSGFKDYVSDEYFKNIALPSKSKSRQAGKINLFAIFLLKGKKLIHKEGNLIYIIPNNILRGTVYDVIRYELLKNANVTSIVDLGEGVFSKVTASTILLQLANKTDEKFETEVITDVESLQENKFNTKYINQNVFLDNTSYTFNIMLNKKQLALSSKIDKNKKSLGECCIDIIAGIAATKDLIFEKAEDETFELFEGKDIKRFYFGKAKNHILWKPNLIARTRPDYLWKEGKKIVNQRISGGKMPLVFALDTQKRRTFNSTNNIVLKKNLKDYYEFFTCLLNSKLINWYYANNFSNNSNLTVNISKTFLETLPIQLPQENVLAKINDLHIELENTYGTDTFNENYELLNIIIYKLYNLTHQEVLLIDSKFSLTQEEYDNYKI